MTQEKMRKVITALASAATVLLITLFSYLVYQWITIAVYNKRIKELEAEITYWTQKKEEAQDIFEYSKSEYYLQDALIRYGFTLDENKKDGDKK